MTTVEPVEPATTGGLEQSRRWWMDNVRVAVIAGVIVFHVALTYVLDSAGSSRSGRRVP